MENVFTTIFFFKVRLWRAFAPPAWQSGGDRPFKEMPLQVIIVGTMLNQRARPAGWLAWGRHSRPRAMPVLTKKNPGYATAKETSICQSIFPTSLSSEDKTQET